MLAKSKLNSIETLKSQALIDLDIVMKNLKQIIKKLLKELIRNIKSNNEKDELSEKNKNNKKILKLHIFLLLYIENV